MAVELKDFIKATLLDIVSAIDEAQREAPEGAIIAPTVTCISQNEPNIRWDDKRGHSIVSFIEFDVAVSVSSEFTKSNDKTVGIKVIETVLGFSHKDRKSESDSFENASRIKFSIPLMYPQKIPKLEQLMKNQ